MQSKNEIINQIEVCHNGANFNIVQVLTGEGGAFMIMSCTMRNIVLSQLDYRNVHKDKVLDFYHTETREDHRGKGLAALVVHEAFEFARREGKQVLPSCTYISHFVEKNGSSYSKFIYKNKTR